MFLRCPLSVSKSPGLIKKPLNPRKSTVAFFSALFLLLTSLEESIMFMGNARSVEMFIPNQEDHACLPAGRGLPVGELVLWYGMFALVGVFWGQRALPVGLHQEVRSVL
jgi:hypothetical protein